MEKIVNDENRLKPRVVCMIGIRAQRTEGKLLKEVLVSEALLSKLFNRERD